MSRPANDKTANDARSMAQPACETVVRPLTKMACRSSLIAS